MTKKILPGHGSGGKLMNDMISGMIKEILGRDSIQIDDSAVLDIEGGKIAFTTDSYTVTPIFFPGGDIGKLAVNGTVNDLAVMGATPEYISCALILEEGFGFDEFEKILISMKESADYAGVKIVTGDTKVVPNGKGDRIYINTSGIGVFRKPVQRKPVEKGDKIILSGTAGDHGITIMSLRNNLNFSSALKSDCAPLNKMIENITEKFPGSIKFMRDATRGGVASVMNEITAGMEYSAKLIEESIKTSEFFIEDNDVLCIASKVVSVAEGQVMSLNEIQVSDVAKEIHRNIPRKDPRIIEIMLNLVNRDLSRLDIKKNYIGCRLENGLKLTSGGIDRKSVDEVFLLPNNPDASAKRISEYLKKSLGKNVAVVITDSDGREDKRGATQVAIGIYGIHPLRKTEVIDSQGETIKFQEETLCDMIAACAGLVMGQRGTGIPAVIVKGLEYEWSKTSNIKEAINEGSY